MQKKQKRSTWVILLCAAALLALVILLENTMKPTHMLFTVLKKGAVYAVVASSMNLLNGFTGLFSLGQAGFMLLGAYTYAILTIPTAARESVYYIYQGSAVNFSLPELFGGGAAGLVLGVLAALVLAGFVAAVVAWLIGLPVLDADTGEELGILEDILTPSVQRVYVVRGKREILIPAVDEFVVETNLEAGYVKVRLIEGM